MRSPKDNLRRRLDKLYVFTYNFKVSIDMTNMVKLIGRMDRDLEEMKWEGYLELTVFAG